MSIVPFSGVFSEELLASILALPAVAEARDRLTTTPGKVQFSIPATETLRATLFSRLGLQIPADKAIPMRWIQGETASHVDSGASAFHDTYLVYLTQSPGSFVVEGTEYPIEANTGFRFSEGLRHETVNTGPTARLLLGPMNEFAEPVGSNLMYFLSEADALAGTPVLAYSNSWTVETHGGYSSWRLASNSSGSSSQAVVYVTGNVLNSGGNYYLYPAIPCFLEGTEILCSVEGKEVYLPVEDLRPGTLVKTSRGTTKAVVAIGTGSLQNPGTSERTENRLYKLSPRLYRDLTKDLYITGCHSILVESLTEAERAATINKLGNAFVTDGKYRLMACIDQLAEPWASEGSYPIWHFALEHTDLYMNYGVFANGGLVVETCSINFMRNKSNLRLL